MSKKTDEKQGRAMQHIERVRHAVRRMRGKYRLDIAPSHHSPVEACRSIAELWLVLGVPDSAPVLHGDPLERDLKFFRAECFVALELLDDIEAAVVARDAGVAGLLLPPLHGRITKLWRCCEGLKVKQERDAAEARGAA